MKVMLRILQYKRRQNRRKDSVRNIYIQQTKAQPEISFEGRTPIDKKKQGSLRSIFYLLMGFVMHPITN